MNTSSKIGTLSIVLAAACLLAPDTAHAFRCKNKIVRDGMHEQQVIAACGEPTTRRHLGYSIRSYAYYQDAYYVGGHRRFGRPGYGVPSEEVAITEFTYNFGPRKLMRRLVFEGGILITIESIGYGYRE